MESLKTIDLRREGSEQRAGEQIQARSASKLPTPSKGFHTAGSSNGNPSIMILPNEILLEVSKLTTFPNTLSLRSTNKYFHALMPNPPFFRLPLDVRFRIFKSIDDTDYRSMADTCHNIRDSTKPTRAKLAIIESALESFHGCPKSLACYTCLRFLGRECFPPMPRLGVKYMFPSAMKTLIAHLAHTAGEPKPGHVSFASTLQLPTSYDSAVGAGCAWINKPPKNPPSGFVPVCPF